MKYPMKTKKEYPLFNYLVKNSAYSDYLLFFEFDDAIKAAYEESFLQNFSMRIYEIYFDPQSLEYFGKDKFEIFKGHIYYDKDVAKNQSLYYYVNNGEWLNPNQNWIEMLGRIKFDTSEG